MKTIQYDQLVIEITRACNMSCPHCMRGKAEDKDLNLDALGTFLDHVENVSVLTLTGGEPSIRVPIMNQVLDMFREKQIPVYGFYLVTNGLEISNDFLLCIFNWYMYIIESGGDRDHIHLALSRDAYHDEIPNDNEELLRAFSFFSEDKFTDWNYTKLIHVGRAADYFSIDETRPADYSRNIYADDWGDDILRIEGDITLTVNGDILAGCDYAYTDTDKIKIGSTSDMPAYMKYIQSEIEKSA